MIPTWIILTLLSALFIAGKDILSKNLLKHNTKSTDILFIQSLVSTTIITLLFFSKINFLSFTTLWDVLIIKALTLFLFNFFFLKLLEKYDISLIAPLNNISPVFLIVMSSAFLNEILTPYQLIGILIIITATYFLEINFHNHHRNQPHKIHFNKLKELDWKTAGIVFLMLFVISICAITDKIILKEVNVYTNIFYTAGLTLLILTAYNIKSKQFISSIKTIQKQPQTILLSLLGLLATYFVLAAIAIPEAMVSLIVPIKRTSTVFSSLFGGILFHEKHLLKKITSILIMIGGIFLMSI